MGGIRASQLLGHRRISERRRQKAPVGNEFVDQPHRTAEYAVENLGIESELVEFRTVGTGGYGNGNALPIGNVGIYGPNVRSVRIELRILGFQTFQRPFERSEIPGIHHVLRHQVKRRLPEAADNLIGVHSFFGEHPTPKLQRGEAAIHTGRSIRLDGTVQRASHPENVARPIVQSGKAEGQRKLFQQLHVFRGRNRRVRPLLDRASEGGRTIEIAALVESSDERKAVLEAMRQRFFGRTEFEIRIDFRKHPANGIGNRERGRRIFEGFVNPKGDGLENRVVVAFLPLLGFDVDIRSDDVFETEFGHPENGFRFGRKPGIPVRKDGVLGFVELYDGHGDILAQCCGVRQKGASN